MPSRVTEAPVSPMADPTKGEDTQFVDPDPDKKVVKEDLDNRMELLYVGRKEHGRPCPDELPSNSHNKQPTSGPSPTSFDEMDRRDARYKLDDAENQIMAQIREQRGR